MQMHGNCFQSDKEYLNSVPIAKYLAGDSFNNDFIVLLFTYTSKIVSWNDGSKEEWVEGGDR